MTLDSAVGLLLVLSAVLLIGVVVAQLRTSRRLRWLLVLGLVLRVLGGLVYLYVIGGAYGGGDYELYFREGAILAGSLDRGGPGSLLDPDIWTGGRWWGTGFVGRITGVVLVGIGPTLPGAFIVFSLIGYVGIVAAGLAFHRAYPDVPLERYFVWIALFPSLWFWPAALGKDAVVLCGVGLATLGFVGKRDRPRWLLMTLGVAIVFCIRPQVAATLMFALGLGQWLGTVSRWTLSRTAQGAVFVAIGVGVIVMSSGALDVALFSPDEVEVYLDSRAAVSTRGGVRSGRHRKAWPHGWRPSTPCFVPSPGRSIV